MSSNAIHDWVRADSFTDILQANIVRGRLEVEGIPAVIANEHTITADWTYSLALGGVRVMVPPEFLQEARAIILQIDRGDFLQDDTQDKSEEGLITINEDVCPRCEKPLKRKEHFTWKLSLVVSSLTVLPIPFQKNQFYCEHCRG